MRRVFSQELAWALLIAAGLLAIYLPGLGNPLVFDDTYLTDGSLQKDFGALHLRPRMLSYGSFLWLQALLGDGWWKQRLFNLLLHFGVVAAVWALYREILRSIAPAAQPANDAAPYERSPALGFAMLFFALNPVAVYAVAYLIQRSIVMATLFVAAALWLFARGLRTRRWTDFAGALACYALGVLSKEYAILAPLAAAPIYILVARPSGRKLAILGVAGALAVALVGFTMWDRYGRMFAAPFDEYSRAYIAQLGSLNPDAAKHAYPLSILNESWLFFRYGFLWILPYEGWMSIALRPPFPITWTSFPQVLGPVGYAAVVAGGFLLVTRYRDWRALVGTSLLFAALLFPTEFATVWVQDPFVLYRSYLWAIGIPGLVFFVVHGPPARVLLPVGAVVAILLAWQSLDRVLSLDSTEHIWTDAIEKLPDDPRAVGRWFPYLNRGAEYAEHDRFDLAMRDFERSSALGDLGMGAVSLGSLLSAAGKHEEALKAFDLAQKQGYLSYDYNLALQRGLALLALGRPQDAYPYLEVARDREPPSPAREVVLLTIGKVGLQLGKRDQAVRDLEKLIAVDPRNREGRYLLGMAYVMKGDGQRAYAILDSLVRDDPNGRSYYARALANAALKRKAEALSDIDNAIRLWPDNPGLREWQAKIRQMP